MTQLQQRNAKLLSEKATSEKIIFALKSDFDTKNVEFDEKVRLAQSQALELQQENERLRAELQNSTKLNETVQIEKLKRSVN